MRSRSLWVLLAAAIVPASAEATPGYRYEQSFMQPYLGGTVRELASGNAGQGITAIGVGFPFEFTFYGQSRTGASVTDQGFLNWGGSFGGNQPRTCIPAPFLDPVMAPYWSQDLEIDTATHPDDGVYSATIGSAPNRQWVADWRMHRDSNNEPRRFGVVLHEATGVISFQYTGLGFPAGGDAAVGLQEAGTNGKSTQYSCGSSSLVAGQRIDFIPDPRNLAPPVISGSAVEGQTLSASTGTWDGTEPISLSQAWKRCDPDGANCNFIPQAVAATYTLTATDVNRTLRAVTFAGTQNGDDFVESAPTALVQAAPAGGGTGLLPGGGSGTGQTPGGNGTVEIAAIADLSVRPSAFPPARRGGSVARRRGATVRFTLNRDAVVRFTVQRALPGRRSREGRCVAPRRAPSGKRCTRWRRLRGAFSVEGTAGPNAFRFTGRLRGRALRLGRYRLVARPGEGARKRAPFRITR